MVIRDNSDMTAFQVVSPLKEGGNWKCSSFGILHSCCGQNKTFVEEKYFILQFSGHSHAILLLP